MKIADSAISLSSQHSYQEIHKKTESLTIWDNRVQDAGRQPENGNWKQGLGQTKVNQASLVELSSRALRSRHIRALITPVEKEKEAVADLNLRILVAMIERLTGKKIDITLPEEVGTETAEIPVASPTASEESAVPAETSAGYGLIYDYHETYRESESSSFAAEGIVRTADGKEIDFSVQLNMSREFISEQQLSIRAGDALKDPLMINFAGSAAEIGQRDFVFDIDSDGHTEQISFAGPRSGFLALDLNTDGVINNGSELFGPATGNGFQELAAYDSDGNGWIDESDSIYENLRIWMKTADGQDQLFALGEKGVGAIYLNHISTPFAVKDSNNELLGQVRTSGIFLGEDGSVGTVQQIDLAV